MIPNPVANRSDRDEWIEVPAGELVAHLNALGVQIGELSRAFHVSRDGPSSHSANETKCCGWPSCRINVARTSPGCVLRVHSRSSVQVSTNASSLPFVTCQFPDAYASGIWSTPSYLAPIPPADELGATLRSEFANGKRSVRSAGDVIECCQGADQQRREPRR